MSVSKYLKLMKNCNIEECETLLEDLTITELKTIAKGLGVKLTFKKKEDLIHNIAIANHKKNIKFKPVREKIVISF